MTGSARGPSRPRLSIDAEGAVLYAIGDVHGCYDELRRLEDKIIADAAILEFDPVIVMLGDYVDRGPRSADVLDHLVAPPPQGFERVCLAGNHEAAMLDFLDGRLSFDFWLQMGGLQTLLSYGLDPHQLQGVQIGQGELEKMLRESIPREHVAFLRSLPGMVYTSSHIFVHAGIRPGVDLRRQTDADLMTIRSGFLDRSNELKHWVVHGHTPVRSPALEGRRIGIDTEAYRTGRLTALRIIGKKGRLFVS
ncbi:metallophosphoesterase family protein [Aliihoeflea sp. PC F10.4]